MNRNTNRSFWVIIVFSALIIFTLSLLYKHLDYTTKALKKSQEKIVNMHVDHIAKVDSIFYDLKEVILLSESKLRDLSVEFSVNTIKLSKELFKSKDFNPIKKQLENEIENVLPTFKNKETKKEC